MISDIEAFQDKQAPHIDTADEFMRRARKGLPADRYASTNGLFSAAQGIWAKNAIIAMQTQVILEQHKIITDMLNEIQKRGADAMDATADPMRRD